MKDSHLRWRSEFVVIGFNGLEVDGVAGLVGWAGCVGLVLLSGSIESVIVVMSQVVDYRMSWEDVQGGWG